VEIATESDTRTFESLLLYARAEARRLGGDALVNVRTTAAGPINRRVLLADVVVWDR
jgi:hypothetical protein